MNLDNYIIYGGLFFERNPEDERLFGFDLQELIDFIKLMKGKQK